MMMVRLLVVLVVLSFSASARAAEAVSAPVSAPARRNVVSLALPLHAQRIAIEGERVLSPRVSVGLGVFAGLRYSSWRDEDVPVVEVGGYKSMQSHVGLSPGARFFLTGAAPEGLWVSPRLEAGYGWSRNRLVSGGMTGEPSRGHNWFAGGAVLVGYSMVVEPGLTVQGGVGLGAQYSELTASRSSSMNPDGSGWVAPETRSSSWDVAERVALNVGWAF